MHIDRVVYHKTFNLGMYQSERIGVEIVLNEGEDEKEALTLAKKTVEEYHQANLPPEEECRGFVVKDVPGQSQRPKDQKQALIYDIDSCTELTVLESYRLLANAYPEIKEAYDQKHKKLSNENN